jgi:glycerophosphoryl diester phosphodiesterase
MNKCFYLLIVVAITITACTSTKKTTAVYQSPKFDFEGHRGSRGLMPENTIAAMKKAVDLGVTTLELDVVISKDNQVVVSHDPVFNPTITTTPAGKFLNRKEAQEQMLYKMDYATIRTYDVGLKPHPEFPEQQKINAYKPLLSELLDSVELYLKQKGGTVAYNVEIKSKPATDGVAHPDVSTFCELVMTELKNKHVLDRSIICSFDERPLEYLHQHYPAIPLSYLVGNLKNTVDAQLKKLTFLPDRFSPAYAGITQQVVDDCHNKGVKIIAWTVNKVDDMQRLVDMGVNGLISDYPNFYKQLKLKE